MEGPLARERANIVNIPLGALSWTFTICRNAHIRLISLARASHSNVRNVHMFTGCNVRRRETVTMGEFPKAAPGLLGP